MTGKEIAELTQQLEPALSDLAKTTGADNIAREVTGSIADGLYYRRQVKAAERIMRAVEKIKATGLPAHAVTDRTLRAVIEAAGDEEDPGLQEMWSNLLANEALGDKTAPALLKILSELEPAEAKVLDRLVRDKDGVTGDLVYPDTLDLTPAQIQNLFRLGLLQTETELGTGVAPMSWDDLSEGLTSFDVVAIVDSKLDKFTRRWCSELSRIIFLLKKASLAVNTESNRSSLFLPVDAV